MEQATTLQTMIKGNTFFVPNYQRAYSWEEKEFRTFLNDLKDNTKNSKDVSYYFGHFLFEKGENKENHFNVIDGQQRLTTTIIFLSVLFQKLKEKQGELTQEQKTIYEDMVKRGDNKYSFTTVDYDQKLLREFVIDKKPYPTSNLKTNSSQRIKDAYKYFQKKLKEDELIELLRTIRESRCTRYVIDNVAEASQMFIFQNNRGKSPTDLEIMKAKFIFTILVAKIDKERKEKILKNIQDNFKNIYESIAQIDNHVDENKVLVYTQKIYFNSLVTHNAMEKIDEQLKDKAAIKFIENFTSLLDKCFNILQTIFTKDEKYMEIHALLVIENYAISMPFLIKAYLYDISPEEKKKLSVGLEKLLFRHALIGARADLVHRLKEVFEKFNDDNKNIDAILDTINYLIDTKPKHHWWNHWYWDDAKLKDLLWGWIDSELAKNILWKYENHLLTTQTKGYSPRRFDDMTKKLELEHIAPKVEPKEVASGYGEYDEEFQYDYIDCVGNYLLISKSQNCSIGNKPFKEKLATYTALQQHLEIKDFCTRPELWNKEAIDKRHHKIVDFVLNHC